MNTKKAKTTKLQKVQIKEDNGKLKTIGKYNIETKVFECSRAKSEHFFRKYNAWGLDSATVKFLAKEQATIVLKDTESKWKFESEAIDFIAHGQVVEYKPHRPQYILPIKYWRVLQAKNRACILKCKETTCKYNFALLCLYGGVELDEDSKCTNYEERPENN